MPSAFRFEGDMTSSSITIAALAWARQGAKIIALHGIDEAGSCTCGKSHCRSPGKHPIADLFPKGQHSATTNTTKIHRALTKYPKANLGVILPPGIVALDVDGPEGLSTFKGLGLPSTLSVQTGRGTHHYFRAPQQLPRRKESMVFPRYHQLDVVRKVVAHAKAQGAGRNYLIQHSAGSGKSNSIAWLAHRLAGLHDDADAKIFHSVIVVTDRLVLDQQLQNTIYQFEHKTGVVEKIDENTQQLARAISNGVPIIISTIQKFPFIAQALRTLEEKGEDLAIRTLHRPHGRK